MIPHNKPALGSRELHAVEQILNSGWISEGKEVASFENDFCKYLGWKEGHAVAVSSGTAALYVALISLGIKEEDEVIVPTYVCSAVLNAIYLSRAKPILVDINDDDLNISLEKTKKSKTLRTRVIILTHTFGMPAKIDEFGKSEIPIIEDCAQSLGSKYKGASVGTFGDVAIFSFYASKVITTGHGGMIFSKNKKFVEKIRDFREFEGRATYKPRFNFQMSGLQAALGRVQLKRLPTFLKKRRSIANKYKKVIPKHEVWPPENFDREREPNYYRFLIRSGRASFIKKWLETQGIASIVPIQTFELLHRYLKMNPKDFPIGENVAKSSLSLSVYPALRAADLSKIIKSLSAYYSNYL